MLLGVENVREASSLQSDSAYGASRPAGSRRKRHPFTLADLPVTFNPPAIMSLEQHQRDWEELGELDPLWAVLSENDKRFGKWDVDAFFETGVKEINALTRELSELGLEGRGRALDFGCGVGRLSRALSAHYGHVTGVDISEPMVRRAREFAAGNSNCEFVVNTTGDLARFESQTFDLIYCRLVLQHIPSLDIIRNYIGEFVRVLAPGGALVFQLPAAISFKARVNPRRHGYRLLRSLGVSPKTLMETLKLSPIHMSYIPRSEVGELLRHHGARILKTKDGADAGAYSDSPTYYATR